MVAPGQPGRESRVAPCAKYLSQTGIKRVAPGQGDAAMGRPKNQRTPLPPIWEAPDELWAMIEPILSGNGARKRDPKRIDQR